MPPAAVVSAKILLFLLVLQPGNQDGDGAARDDHEARGAGEARDEHEEDAHEQKRPDGRAEVLPVILVGHRAEEGWNDLLKGRLESDMYPVSWTH